MAHNKQLLALAVGLGYKQADGFEIIACLLPHIKFMRSFYFLIFIAITGCTKNNELAPDEIRLREEFTKHETTFIELRNMITSDARDLDYFQIRHGKIGDYNLEDKGWSKEYGTYVPFSIVTAKYLLTGERYNEYVRLLKLANASAVNYYDGSASITIFSAGFVFGGCSSEIIYHPKAIELSRPSWAQAYFNNKWGGQTKCY